MPSSGAMTQERVRAIIDETMKVFVESDAFLQTIRKAVRDSIQAELSDIIERIDVTEGKIMDMEKRIEKQSATITSLQKSLDRERELVKGLQRFSNQQEQYSRRNCLRFFGVEESSAENTDDHVCRIVNDILRVPITKNDIERSHRVGPPRTPADGSQRRNRSASHSNKVKPRAIIVKFVSYRARKLVISKRRMLKGCKMGIDEDLTKENASLLQKTKACPKVLSSWTSDGRIIALIPATGGKTIKKVINSESDLDLI